MQVALVLCLSYCHLLSNSSRPGTSTIHSESGSTPEVPWETPAAETSSRETPLAETPRPPGGQRRHIGLRRGRQIIQVQKKSSLTTGMVIIISKSRSFSVAVANLSYLKIQCCGPDPHRFAFISVGWIRIQEGQNGPQKWKKFKFWIIRYPLLRDVAGTSFMEA